MAVAELEMNTRPSLVTLAIVPAFMPAMPPTAEMDWLIMIVPWKSEPWIDPLFWPAMPPIWPALPATVPILMVPKASLPLIEPELTPTSPPTELGPTLAEIATLATLLLMLPRVPARVTIGAKELAPLQEPDAPPILQVTVAPAL